jgi:hypothetical protein
MLSATCHCGSVRIEVPRRPRAVTSCNCSICRRYGALWAYYKASSVRLVAPRGATDEYAWGHRRLKFVRCGNCGCVVCWQRRVASRDAYTGVNMRNFDPDQLGAVRIRKLDGAATCKYVE